jgi:hypothetical protein
MSNKNSKTGRTNKTNLSLTWPVMDFFNHQDLKNSNPDFVDITLRVRVKAEIESGKIKDIGVLHNGKGRPKNVYAMSANSGVIEKAKQAGVILHSQYLVEKVADITNASSNPTPTNEVSNLMKAKAAIMM